MLRVMDAPGFYAAFPWGGYARSKGATGTRSNWRTRSIFPSLSPASSTPGSFIRPRWLLTEKYTEGLHPERPARGAVLYTAWIGSHPHRSVRIDRCVVDRDAVERGDLFSGVIFPEIDVSYVKLISP